MVSGCTGVSFIVTRWLRRIPVPEEEKKEDTKIITKVNQKSDNNNLKKIEINTYCES